jgi:endothelin-converting enzyme/putative endopeptidase
MSFRLTLLAAAACGSIATAALAQSAPKFGTWGYDQTAMDRGVKPGDDFFDFVNGAWAKRTEIAADRTFVGIDSVLNDQIERDVSAIVEDMASSPAKSGATGRQVGDYYASFMDVDAIEKAGTAPLKPYLARVAAVKDRGQLLDLFATQQFVSPVGIYIDADPDDPTHYAAYASQAGLGMPNRDYYLLPGAKYDAYRAAYRDYVIRMQTLAGIADPAAKADRIIALEKAIATAHWTPERSRDIKQTNNPMTRAQLARLAPELDWGRSLAGLGLGSQQKVLVRQPSAVAAASSSAMRARVGSQNLSGAEGMRSV